MGLKTIIAKQWAARAAAAIAADAVRADVIQRKLLMLLVRKATMTRFGQLHSFQFIEDYDMFRQSVPVRDYEQAIEFFNRIRQGGEDQTWPGQALYLAKTSGTTSGSKYIPITRRSIRSQIAAARNTLLLYIHHTQKADFLNGKMLFLSGSPVLDKNEWGMKTGRLSGIVNHFIPAYLQSNRIPGWKTNCIEDWEQKVERILDEALPRDLRLISGIPPWVQMFFEQLYKRNGKKPLEQWPNLQVYVSGGVDFQPYAPIFRGYWGDKVDVVETFPASEGFFAFQDQHPDQGLLMNTQAGMFFEFIPLEKYALPEKPRIPLWEVETGKSYVLVVSSDAGLWVYDTGDIIRFVSVRPWRIRVTGRVKHFISAFGEHVIGEEVDRAMTEACALQQCEVREFTVAPFVAEKGLSYHEWFVEFNIQPASPEAFSHSLDQAMRRQNAYYDDLRKGDLLAAPRLRSLRPDACNEYMRHSGRLGGQNKFPRLSNNREIAAFLETRIR